MNAEAPRGVLDPNLRLRELPGVSHHAFLNLEKEGIIYVEQALALSVQELSALVPGRKALGVLMDRLGRAEEWLRFIGKYDVEVVIEGVTHRVPFGACRQVAALNGTAISFGFRDAAQMAEALQRGRRLADGREVEFGWPDIAAFKVRKDQEREAAKALMLNGGGEKVPPIEAVLGVDGDTGAAAAQAQRQAAEAEITRIVQSYEQDYDKRAFLETDRADIQRLASLEYFVNSTQSHIVGLTPAQRLQFANAVNTLQEQVNKGLAEIRRAKDALRVSLATRAADEEQRAGHEIITDLVRDTKEVIANHASVAIHCGVRHALLILPLPTSPQQKVLMMQCAECGELFEWELVTSVMTDLYVEAGDFMPTGAPDGLLAPKAHTTSKSRHHRGHR